MCYIKFNYDLLASKLNIELKNKSFNSIIKPSVLNDDSDTKTNKKNNENNNNFQNPQFNNNFNNENNKFSPNFQNNLIIMVINLIYL